MRVATSFAVQFAARSLATAFSAPSKSPVGLDARRQMWALSRWVWASTNGGRTMQPASAALGASPNSLRPAGAISAIRPRSIRMSRRAKPSRSTGVIFAGRCEASARAFASANRRPPAKENGAVMFGPGGSALSPRPQIEAYALVDELQRVGLLVIEARLHDAGLDHRVVNDLIRSSVIAPIPSFSVSPESVRPYSLILAIEKAICSSVMSGFSFLMRAFAFELSP